MRWWISSGEKAILESDVLVFCAKKEEGELEDEEKEDEGKEEVAKGEKANKDDKESWGQS